MLRQFNYHVIGQYFISLAALQRFRRDSGAILTRFYLDRAITYMTCLVSIKCVVHVHVMVSGLVHSNVIALSEGSIGAFFDQPYSPIDILAHPEGTKGPFGALWAPQNRHIGQSMSQVVLLFETSFDGKESL